MRKPWFAAGAGAAMSLLAAQAGAEPAGTGARDPDALTCDAPQLVPLANAVGWRICVQNSLVATLGNGGEPVLGDKVVGSYSDLPISAQPTGAGDPATVTCQEAQERSGSRARGPIACARNAFWAKLSAAGCVLTPDVRAIIKSGTSKNLDPLACTHIMGRNGKLPPRFF